MTAQQANGCVGAARCRRRRTRGAPQQAGGRCPQCLRRWPAPGLQPGLQPDLQPDLQPALQSDPESAGEGVSVELPEIVRQSPAVGEGVAGNIDCAPVKIARRTCYAGDLADLWKIDTTKITNFDRKAIVQKTLVGEEYKEKWNVRDLVMALAPGFRVSWGSYTDFVRFLTLKLVEDPCQSINRNKEFYCGLNEFKRI